MMSKLLAMKSVALLYDVEKKQYRVITTKGRFKYALAPVLHFEAEQDLPWLADEQVPEVLAQNEIYLLIPIRSNEQHLGFIGLGKRASNEKFSLETLEFAQSVVDLSATAVQNALVVEALRHSNRDLDRKVQQLNTLFDLAKELGNALEESTVLKLFSFALMGQLGVAKYAFLWRKSAHFEVVSSKGIGKIPISEALSQILSEQENVIWQPHDFSEEWANWEMQLWIPLQMQDTTKGFLGLGKKMLGGNYTQSDVEFLTSLGQLTLTSLENASLLQNRIENQLLQKELQRARIIQERLLPQKTPEFSGLDMAYLSIPAQQVGGDFFELYKIDEQRLLFAIADVTGKGISAALLMSNLQAALHTLLAMDGALDLPKATQHINRVICQNTDPDKFITFVWGIYNQDTHSIRYVNAGHDHPILHRKNGTLKRLETGGLFLGFMPNWTYQEENILLEEGDTLLLFTDGITEAMNPHGEEYGMARLEQLLNTSANMSATALHIALFDDVRRFTEGEPQSDDITVVILKRD